MKAFNLAQAKAGAPLITRDCRKATFIAHHPGLSEGDVIIAVDGELEQVFTHGGYYGQHDVHVLDIFMAPKEVKLYLNIYEDHFQGGYSGFLFASKERAEHAANSVPRITGESVEVTINI